MNKIDKTITSKVDRCVFLAMEMENLNTETYQRARSLRRLQLQAERELLKKIEKMNFYSKKDIAMAIDKGDFERLKEKTERDYYNWERHNVPEKERINPKAKEDNFETITIPITDEAINELLDLKIKLGFINKEDRQTEFKKFQGKGLKAIVGKLR